MSTIRPALPSYSTGTIQGTFGSPNITGTGTNWFQPDQYGNPVAVVSGGDILVIPSLGISSIISSVATSTALTLYANLPSTVTAGTAYVIVKYQANQSGGFIQMIGTLLAQGGDSAPDLSRTIDSGAGRIKLRVGSAGDLQIAVGPTGTADGNLKTAIDISQAGAVSFPVGAPRTAIADAAYAILATDRLVALTSLSASRTLTLCAAASYPVSTRLLVVDESGACSATNTIVVTRSGTDTINGGASWTLATPYAFVELESNGAGKWVVVDASSGTPITNANGGPLAGFRNLIINGNFAINQRAYASGAALTAAAFAHDRWRDYGQGSCTYTYTQTNPDTLINVTNGILQTIESYNVTGNTYTLSWAGTVQLTISYTNTSGVGTYAVSVTSPYTINNVKPGTAVQIYNQTNGTLGLVQFEPGSVATPFERRPLGIELFLCRRYFQRFGGAANGSLGYTRFGAGPAVSQTSAYIQIFILVALRASPSLSYSGNFVLYNGSSSVPTTSMVIDNGGPTAIDVLATASGLTSGTFCALTAANDATAVIDLNAEI